MDHAEIKHLIPLKALSRLDGDEARAVDDHLAAGCDECERELASFTEALAAMAIAESGGDGPSDRIWSRLQARLEADRPPPRLEDRSTREPSRGRGFAMLVPAAIAAVIAIAVSTALFNWRMRTDSSDMSNEIAALTARVVEVQRNLDTTGDQLAALEAKVAQNTDLTLASLGPDSQVVRWPDCRLHPRRPAASRSIALRAPRCCKSAGFHRRPTTRCTRSGGSVKSRAR